MTRIILSATLLVLTLLLDACGGGGGSSTIARAPATATVPSSVGIRDNIVITFSAAMDPYSLVFSGELGPISDGGTWSTGNMVLTLAPDSLGAWESGNKSLRFTVYSAAGASTTVDTTIAIDFKLSTFQNASVVIGQPDFTSNYSNQGGGSTPAANTLIFPYGYPAYFDDALWVTDFGNQRILGYAGIPTSNDASATYLVGQTTFTGHSLGTSDTMISNPQGFIKQNGYYYLDDYGNNRVLIYDTAPYNVPPGTATGVLGQPDFTSKGSGCGPTSFNYPEVVFAVGTKLMVADGSNARVLIWNTLPTATGTPPDIVLGQADFTHCAGNDDNQDGSPDAGPTARTIAYAAGVWSDGTRLAVIDLNNNRVLIWNSFPTASFQPADIVLGQADFTTSVTSDPDTGKTSARTMNTPYNGVWSNGRQFLVADDANNRVLVWNSFPTSNFQPADVVIGQIDFTTNAKTDPDTGGISARTMQYPCGISLVRDKLLVDDTSNSRVLIYRSN